MSGYVKTIHAKQRIGQRKVPKRMLNMALCGLGEYVGPGNKPNTCLFALGDLVAVTNPYELVVITVFWRGAKRWLNHA